MMKMTNLAKSGAFIIHRSATMNEVEIYNKKGNLYIEDAIN